ncbi:MAG: nitroreductase family protein [Asticcacaulis sp.]
MSTNRQSDHPIHPQFLDRWSPRAFTDTAVTEAEVLTVLEAARWAPSASNLQPWRFIYALKGTPEFDAFVEDAGAVQPGVGERSRRLDFRHLGQDIRR